MSTRTLRILWTAAALSTAGGAWAILTDHFDSGTAIGWGISSAVMYAVLGVITNRRRAIR